MIVNWVRFAARSKSAPRPAPPAAKGLWALLLCLALAGGASAASEGIPRPARVTTASADRVVFRVAVDGWSLDPSANVEGASRISLPGYLAHGEPGEPALAVRQFLVALPEQGSWRLSYRVLASQPLGVQRLEPVPFQKAMRDDQLGPLPTVDYRRDEEAWSRFRSPAVAEARDPAWIRRQRVLPVVVSPIQYDAASGETVLATEIEVTVTFQGARASRAPGARREAPMWDRLFGRLLLNPDQARGWRQAAGGRRAPSPSPPALRQSSLVRLKVRQTGIHKVTASVLASAGFPPGQAVSDLHLFQRTYDVDTHTAGVDDVALHVEEDVAGVPGVFDGDDMLVFYGRRLRDDPDQEDAVEKYADHNVYWLGTTSGPTMAQRGLAPGAVTTDTAVTWFDVNEHFEIDGNFNEGIRPGLGADFYTFNDGEETGDVDMPFAMWSVRPGTNVTLRSEMFGKYYTLRTLWVGMSNTQGELTLNSSYSIPNKNKQTFQANVPAASFDAGANAFRIRRPNTSRPAVHVMLNWVEAQYQALYRAVGDRLEFHTGSLSGDTSVTVTGIGDPDLWLFDVTDPDRPVRCLAGAPHFFDLGGSWALSFRDTIAAQKRYTLLPESAMLELTAADISEDTPSGIIGHAAEAGVDVLVVSHADYIAQMGQWVTYRRAQGYRVLLVDVEDVFDEFNNGVPHAHAIDRFVRRFYDMGAAGALLLVGDCSEDNKRVHATSGPNFVPTHTWPDAVPSLSLDEVVTTDKRYVLLPGPGGAVDAYPDMVVGRLPVGGVTELTIVLAKTLQFDQPKAHELWRRRIIVFADDRYSEGASAFGGFQYCPQAEWAFETGQEQSATIMERGTGGYEVARFYLSTYSEGFYQSTCKPQLAAWQFGRNSVNPQWMTALEQGASIVTMQAHMNRSQVTHEVVFSTFSATRLGSSTGRDHLRVNNRDKPWVMFGMGCHFSDYALHKEQDPQSNASGNNNAPNGDAFSEQLLFGNAKGAVATYGSSGFEYLNQTNNFMNLLAKVWFYDAPYDTMVNQTQGRWVFGELMFLVENQIAFAQARPVERYHILGDPLLRIDAGPPAFDVTVNGVPFASGEQVQAGGADDTLRVVAVVSDENAIDEFALTDAGVPQPGALTVTPLVGQPPFARAYRVEFSHVARTPDTYDVVLTARQAPDTVSGQFHMEADFVIRVESSVVVFVNGRLVESGDKVAARGNYRVEMTFPVFVPESDIAVAIDSVAVDGPQFSHLAPEDSTTWIVTFSKALSDGSHLLQITTAGRPLLERELVVSSAVGLRHVMPFPNPFTDGSHIVFTNDVAIADGSVDIFTTSGRRIRRLVIPPRASQPGQNAVFWDGRDRAGDQVANGTYLFIVTVTQRGQKATATGKISRLR